MAHSMLPLILYINPKVDTIKQKFPVASHITYTPSVPQDHSLFPAYPQTHIRGQGKNRRMKSHYRLAEWWGQYIPLT